MLSLGPEFLSDAELLAILLGTGNLQETALDVAKRLLQWGEENYGEGLGFLEESTVEEIMSLRGIGPAKAARFKACLEVFRRLGQAKGTGFRISKVHRGKDVYELLRGEMEHLDREHFCIIMLNVRNQVIRKETVSIGSLDTSIAHPREIFKNCIKKSAAAVVLAHNHPSGEAAPSDDDISITKRIIEAGKIVGIHVLDHVVIGKGQYVSMRESFTDWFTW